MGRIADKSTQREANRLVRSGMLAALLLGCSSESEPGPDHGSWQIVHQELDEALISVWGTSASDVYAVGSDAGQGPIVLHFDGAEWERLTTGAAGDLWWVHGFEGGPVFLGGAGGQILRYENGSFAAETTPGTLTVFGIWGSSPSDVWAVGGGGVDGAFAWRYDGAGWTDVPLPAGVREDVSLFKVWGRAADDVWLVGTEGAALHWDGTAFEKADAKTTRTLFTVHADAERFTAVGGFGAGVIVENDGSGWIDVTPADGFRQMIGVSTTSAGAFAAGDFGSVLERRDGAWAEVEHGLEVFDSFHAVWVDPEGGVWAVGGQVQSLPLKDGVMIHRGSK